MRHEWNSRARSIHGEKEREKEREWNRGGGERNFRFR